MKSFNLHLSRMYSLTKGGFALFGLAALCGFVFLPSERHLVRNSLPEFAAEAPSEISVAGGSFHPDVIELVQEREQRALAEFISRRWRIADTAATSYVAIAYRAGKRHHVDPVLILSVMAIESRYNPVAESVVGAKGLMQIIPK